MSLINNEGYIAEKDVLKITTLLNRPEFKEKVSNIIKQKIKVNLEEIAKEKEEKSLEEMSEEEFSNFTSLKARKVFEQDSRKPKWDLGVKLVFLYSWDKTYIINYTADADINKIVQEELEKSGASNNKFWQNWSIKPEEVPWDKWHHYGKEWKEAICEGEPEECGYSTFSYKENLALDILSFKL